MTGFHSNPFSSRCTIWVLFLHGHRGWKRLQWRRCEICGESRSRQSGNAGNQGHRVFANFDDFWLAKQTAPSIGATIAAMSSAEVKTLKERVRARLPSDAEGRITYGARANAILGRVPA